MGIVHSHRSPERDFMRYSKLGILEQGVCSYYSRCSCRYHGYSAVVLKSHQLWRMLLHAGKLCKEP